MRTNHKSDWINQIVADLKGQGINVTQETRNWLSQTFETSLGDCFDNGGIKDGWKHTYGWLSGEFCKYFNAHVRNGIREHLSSL